MHVNIRSFTPDLTALHQHKNILWRSALASKSPHDMQLFREVRYQNPQFEKASLSFPNRNLHPVALIPKVFGTLKSMENKSTSSQLPTALSIGNSLTINLQ
jgi:hypothetical protein